MAGEAAAFDILPDPEDNLGRRRRQLRRASEQAEVSAEPSFDEAVMAHIDSLSPGEQAKVIGALTGQIYERAELLIEHHVEGADEMVREIAQRANWLTSKHLNTK